MKGTLQTNLNIGEFTLGGDWIIEDDEAYPANNLAERCYSNLHLLLFEIAYGD